MDPCFLDLDEVIAIHQDQLARYGGMEGIRDIGLLTSALSQPKATFGGRFLHADLGAMAAAYLFHLVQNHPFLDGNKRTGAMSAYVFLSLNGMELNMQEDDFEELLWQTAQSECDVAQVASTIRKHLEPSI